MIQINNISKSYGKTEVLRNIKLHIQPHETVAIIGPSGSGKSTLIKTINGLEPINKGSIFVGGHDITTITPVSLSKAVGMVFQDFGLFNNKTVLGNCTIPLTVVHKQDIVDAELAAKIRLVRLGLASHFDHYPHNLSGGQKQRVAIARALVVKPQIMLYDEPTSALDPEMVNDVLDAIEDLKKEGMTQVVVTHEMSFARRVADRIVFMVAGEIVEVAKSEEFFTNPKTDRAKAFLSALKR